MRGAWQARQVLNVAAELERTARRFTGNGAGLLCVRTVSDPAAICLGQLLARAGERFPGLELELHHDVSGAALQGVRAGSLDASCCFGDAPGPDIKSLRLRQFVYRIAAVPWILTSTFSTYNRLVAELCAAQGIDPPQRHIEADQQSVIENLVFAGVGVSLIRQENAIERARAGDVLIRDKARLRTTLRFVCAAARGGINAELLPSWVRAPWTTSICTCLDRALARRRASGVRAGAIVRKSAVLFKSIAASAPRMHSTIRAIARVAQSR